MRSGIRELTPEEIEFVSGGTYIPGYGWVIDGSGGGGYYGGTYPGGGGYYGGTGPGSSEQNVRGINVNEIDCQQEVTNLEGALDELRKASPAAGEAIDKAKQHWINYGGGISLVNDGIDATFYTGKIDWDPYSAIKITDSSGNIMGYQSAMIGLIHEIGHLLAVGQGDAESNRQSMLLENKVIAEINAYYGRQVETARSEHSNGIRYIAPSSTSHAQVENRPHC